MELFWHKNVVHKWFSGGVVRKNKYYINIQCTFFF